MPTLLNANPIPVGKAGRGLGMGPGERFMVAVAPPEARAGIVQAVDAVFTLIAAVRSPRSEVGKSRPARGLRWLVHQNSPSPNG